MTLAVLFILLLPCSFAREISKAIYNLDDSNFKETVAVGDSLVYFFAPWCGNCQRFHPTYQQLAKELWGTSLLVAEINCDLNPQIAADQKIAAYPTIQYLRNGVIIQTFQGDRTVESLLQWVYGLNVQIKHEREARLASIAATANHQQSGTSGSNTASTGKQKTVSPETDEDDSRAFIIRAIDAFPKLLEQHPYSMSLCIFMTGVFTGMFLGVIYVLREKGS